MAMRIRKLAITAGPRVSTLIKLLPLVLLVLALAGGVIADGIPGGGACPGC